MIVTITDGARNYEADSPWTTAKAVGDLVAKHGGGFVTINFTPRTVSHQAEPEVPQVRDSGPNQLLHLEDGGALPKRVRKERSDKGKPRK